MAKPFDATLKELVQRYPADWLDQLGLPATGPVELIDADLSTITTQADKLIRVGGPDPWLMHLELQASRDTALDRRVLRYNVLAHDRHELPVHSVIVLLRPEAEVPKLNGLYSARPTHGRSSIEFEYQVLRLWEQPVELVLAGGVGTLPLAPLCGVPREALPGVIHRMEERLQQETTAEEAATIWASTYILLGLRYPREVATQLLQGVRDMKESTTYQAILEEGESSGLLKEARKLVFLLGQRRFGPPDTATRTAIEKIESTARLEQMAERLFSASGWDELLAS